MGHDRAALRVYAGGMDRIAPPHPSDTRLVVARWLLPAIFALGLGLRALAFSFWNIHHPDGLLQYLEQAHRLVVGRGIVPWEYRIGIRNWLVPLFLTPGMALGEAFDPGGLAGAYLARLTHAALGLGAMWAGWRMGRATSVAAGLMAALVVAVWYESVLFSVELLSESTAAPLMLMGVALLCEDKGRRRVGRHLGWAGAALAMAALIRFLWAGFAGVLALATLRGDWRGWRALVLGALPVLVLGAVVDMAMGQVPYLWVIRNFAQNIGAGQAARFGTAPAWEYLRLLYLNFGVTLPIVAGASLLAGRRYGPVGLAALANVGLHSLIGHKEFRFIWISVLVMLVLAAIGSVSAAQRVAADKERPLVPYLLGLAVLWCTLSGLAYKQTGGQGAFRGGGQTGLALYDAAHRRGVCGVMLTRDLVLQTSPVLEGAATPIYVAPKSVPMTAIPPELAAAANAYVSEAPPPALGSGRGYVRAACHANNGFAACLYIRPGPCAAQGGARYTQQIALQEEGY